MSFGNDGMNEATQLVGSGFGSDRDSNSAKKSFDMDGATQLIGPPKRNFDMDDAT